MGIGGISVGSLLIVLVIVLLLFGTKKLRSIGSDLGGAFKGFRDAVKEGESAAQEGSKLEQAPPAATTESEKTADRQSS